MIPFHWTTAGLGVVLSIFIIILVRKDFLHTKYSLWWLAVSVVVVIFGIWPRLSDSLARVFGVAYPPSLIFIAAAGYILVKMLTMDIDRSRMEIKLRRLTQRMALLEDLIRESREAGDANADDAELARKGGPASGSDSDPS